MLTITLERTPSCPHLPLRGVSVAQHLHDVPPAGAVPDELLLCLHNARLREPLGELRGDALLAGHLRKVDNEHRRVRMSTPHLHILVVLSASHPAAAASRTVIAPERRF
eukprot:4683859-Pyramimonas_sp.AAC.2